MLALSLTPAADKRDPDWNSTLPTADTEPRLTWRRWVDMLKPDTPAQHQEPYDGWSTTDLVVGIAAHPRGSSLFCHQSRSPRGIPCEGTTSGTAGI